jgi:hypothetical protein
MKTIDTWVKKITFEMQHPSHKENRLVRTLVVSDTIYAPDGYPVPSHADLGFISFDHRDEKDWPLLRDLIVAEVIRSKIDGLSPSGVSEAMRSVKESTFNVIRTSGERKNSYWHARFAIKVVMPGSSDTPYWYDPTSRKLVVHTRSAVSSVNDPYFLDNCMWVSDMVAASKAQDLLKSWKDYGFTEQPVSAEVKEVCYGVQQIQLVSEFQRDALHGGVCAFTPYRSAQMV